MNGIDGGGAVWSIVLGLLCFYSVVAAENREVGVPFFINYGAEVYGAHDRNASVVCDTSGNCYFANFEGVLKFDGCTWELITTPGISRVTALAADERGVIMSSGGWRGIVWGGRFFMLICRMSERRELVR